ncbi:hypothetical protein OOT46_27515 [Aquabacterium sp. A7-Y]|uniref:hypothetical protein n=1 Tax=Aquabacterium sp. A7-Y TaxID=1349605 RepID=UPI00223D03F8|nr:hypothetical protein [Aquabacterium sp. A7-Y]MCW7541558.1 hypothetical protein [Aquabacterium sp. A7-Y]
MTVSSRKNAPAPASPAEDDERHWSDFLVALDARLPPAGRAVLRACALEAQQALGSEAGSGRSFPAALRAVLPVPAAAKRRPAARVVPEAVPALLEAVSPQDAARSLGTSPEAVRRQLASGELLGWRPSRGARSVQLPRFQFELAVPRKAVSALVTLFRGQGAEPQLESFLRAADAALAGLSPAEVLAAKALRLSDAEPRQGELLAAPAGQRLAAVLAAARAYLADLRT